MIRREGHQYPILLCPRRSCELSHDSRLRVQAGREYAEQHAGEPGIMGESVPRSSRPRRSRAVHLAEVAHHDIDVQAMDADQLIAWFRCRAEGATDSEIAEFLESHLEYEHPRIAMEDVCDVAEGIVDDEILDELVGADASRNVRLVAATAYAMSLYRGQSARVSFSSRMIESGFIDSETEKPIMSRTTAAKATKSLVQAGVLRIIQRHQIYRGDGELIFRSPVFEFCGRRPFDSVRKKIAELKFLNPNFPESTPPLDQMPVIRPDTPWAGAASAADGDSDVGADIDHAAVIYIVDCVSGQADRGKKFEKTCSKNKPRDWLFRSCGGDYWSPFI